MRGNMVTVAKEVTCNRCGKDDCAWMQNKAGKWYLVDGVYTTDGGTTLIASKVAYHKCISSTERH